VRARGLLGIASVLLMTGCTANRVAAPTSAQNDKSYALFAPAPRECGSRLVRGTKVDARDAGRVLKGHVPTLPAGFGLYGAYANRVGIWQDGRCREVMVGIYPGARVSRDGPRVGRWRLINDAPGKCYTVELGKTGCLEYQTKFGNDVVTVQMLGVSRTVGDPIVRSIS
jgi:hypothetical protein